MAQEPSSSPAVSGNAAGSSRTTKPPSSGTADGHRNPAEGAQPPLPTGPTGAAAADEKTTQPPQQQPNNNYYYAPYPYHPQPPPPGASAYTPARPLPQQTRSWLALRLGLTVFSSVVGLVAIGLSCGFLGPDGIDGGGEAAITPAYVGAIAGLAVLWNAAELITYCVRSRRSGRGSVDKVGKVQRGIHPGAHVGLHLCIWLLYALTVLATATLVVSAESIARACAKMSSSSDSSSSSSSSGYSDGYSDDYGYGNYYDDSYCDDIHLTGSSSSAYVSMLQALEAMLCLATLCHFVLFVLACIDTHRRNVLRPTGMVFSAPAPYPGPHQPPPPPPGMAPMPYYPYAMPMGAPPPQGHFAPAQQQQGGGTQPAQPHQSLAGFYAPQATHSHAAAPASPQARAPSPRQATGSHGEGSTTAGPAQA
ncbi:hypothetical protein GGR56DRAFT_326221 [Xylariaceae sp. FL0804]|nr:hypothetical protein GGR56DRAFT_326221 [Xylariaceae sp. FL0804]